MAIAKKSSFRKSHKACQCKPVRGTPRAPRGLAQGGRARGGRESGRRECVGIVAVTIHLWIIISCGIALRANTVPSSESGERHTIRVRLVKASRYGNQQTKGNSVY